MVKELKEMVKPLKEMAKELKEMAKEISMVLSLLLLASAEVAPELVVLQDHCCKPPPIQMGFL